MVKAAKGVGRHGNRDATLILLAYRHGLRVSKLVTWRWEQVDFSGGTIYINRLKHGVSSTHPLRITRKTANSPLSTRIEVLFNRWGTLDSNSFRIIENSFHNNSESLIKNLNGRWTEAANSKRAYWFKAF
jgi:integrase